jgi:hypothetical protein
LQSASELLPDQDWVLGPARPEVMIAQAYIAPGVVRMGTEG